jgi:hypothetical protein
VETAIHVHKSDEKLIVTTKLTFYYTLNFSSRSQLFSVKNNIMESQKSDCFLTCVEEHSS